MFDLQITLITRSIGAGATVGNHRFLPLNCGYFRKLSFGSVALNLISGIRKFHRQSQIRNLATLESLVLMYGFDKNGTISFQGKPHTFNIYLCSFHRQNCSYHFK